MTTNIGTASGGRRGNIWWSVSAYRGNQRISHYSLKGHEEGRFAQERSSSVLPRRPGTGRSKQAVFVAFVGGRR